MIDHRERERWTEISITRSATDVSINARASPAFVGDSFLSPSGGKRGRADIFFFLREKFKHFEKKEMETSRLFTHTF